MPHTNQDPVRDGDKVAAFLRAIAPVLEAKLRQATASVLKPVRKAGMLPGKSYEFHREECATYIRDAVLKDGSTIARLAESYDPQAGSIEAFLFGVARNKGRKYVSNNILVRRRHVSASPEAMQAIIDGGFRGEPADARLLREEGENVEVRQKKWRRAVERESQRLITAMEGRPGEVAHRFVVLGLDFDSISREVGIKRETVLDHWYAARNRLAEEIDLHAVADECDVKLDPRLTNAAIIDLLYREFR